MQYYCKIMILTNLFGAVWDHTLLHICALTTDTNFLMSTFLSAIAVHCLHHSLIFIVLKLFSRQIAKTLGKLVKTIEGVAIWRIFCKEKSKDVSDVFLILSDLRRDRLIFLLIFIAFSHRENLSILAFS